jgi:hypothetical protein
VAGRVPAVGKLTLPGRLPGVKPVDGLAPGVPGRVLTPGRAPPVDGRAAGRDAAEGGRLMEGERPIDGDGR